MIETWYECKSKGSCSFRSLGSRGITSCGAPDSFRRACKQYVPHSKRSKIKVLGVTTVARSEDRSKCSRGQARYVAAVSSRKEFAELIGSSFGFINNYAGVTGNDEEVKKALANPHKLIFVESR